MDPLHVAIGAMPGQRHRMLPQRSHPPRAIVCPRWGLRSEGRVASARCTRSIASMATTGTVEQPRAPAATISSSAVPRDAKVSDKPPTAAAGTTQELPAGALIRVVLTYPHGDTAAAGNVAEAGAGVTDRRTWNRRSLFQSRRKRRRKASAITSPRMRVAATDLGQRLHGEYGEPKLAGIPRAAGQHSAWHDRNCPAGSD